MGVLLCMFCNAHHGTNKVGLVLTIVAVVFTIEQDSGLEFWFCEEVQSEPWPPTFSPPFFQCTCVRKLFSLVRVRSHQRHTEKETFIHV